MWYDYVCVIGVQGESMPTNTVQAVSPYYNPTIEEVSTVPNIKSAKKRVKVAAAKTLQNKMINSQLKTEIKKANVAIESNAADKAEAVYPLAYVPNSVRYYVNGVLQTAPTATPEPPLVITVPNVPANGSIMLVYEAEVTAYAPLGTNGSITNTANVTDGNLEVSASETVSTDDRAVLTISKALCPAVVTGNGQITYTFVIENTGNTEASEAERIVLTDTFDPILKNIAVTFNGTAWTAGTQYTYGETTGVFATLPGQITVPAAQYTQNENGTWATTPGTAEVVITGTV